MLVAKRVNGSFKLDILYLMFLVMSGIFWQERIINQDTAFTMFNITAFETFDIAHYRFTDVLTQSIPILLTKLNFSLGLILFSYSIALSLFPYLLFRVTLYTLKDKGVAWLMFLAQILFVSDYFFDAISQSKLAMAIVLLFAALIKNRTAIHSKITYYSFVVIVLILAILCHPIAPVLLAILIVWVFVNDFISKKDLSLFIGLIGALLILKHFIFPNSGYENGMISQVTSIENWLNIFQENYVLEFFKAQFKSIYLWGIILFFFLLTRLLRSGKTKLTLLYVLCNLGLFALLLITFKQGDSNMMMEKNLSTLAVVVLLPFIGQDTNSFYVLNSIKVKFFLPFLCLFFLNRINNASIFYSQRQNTLNNWIEIGKEYGHQKYLINQETLSNTSEINLWSLPYETALLSTIKHSENSITIKNIKEVEYWRGLHTHKDAFIGADFFMPYDTKKFKSNLYNFGKDKYYLLEVHK